MPRVGVIYSIGTSALIKRLKDRPIGETVDILQEAADTLAQQLPAISSKGAWWDERSGHRREDAGVVLHIALKCLNERIVIRVGERQWQAHEATTRQIKTAQVHFEMHELAQIRWYACVVSRAADWLALRVKAQHRALAQHLDRRAMLFRCRIEPRPEPVASCIEPHSGLRRIDLVKRPAAIVSTLLL
jgi:hypothetical protein